MICVMHYALTASTTAVADPSVVLPAYLIPAHVLGLAVVAAVLLVMGSGFSTYIIDLRVRTESADRINQLSFNDTMTGLPNRIAFNERLAFDAAEAHEKAHKLAAFSIDLDGFKDVNDVFGHGAGDLLLIEVAERMRRMLGTGEFLARQSGDEFLGLQMSGNHPQDAQAFAERIAGVFAEPFQVQDQQVSLTAAIGYSIFPIDTPERDQVLSNAKLAMYRGKSKQRGGTICRYEPRDGRRGPGAAGAGARPAIRGRARRTGAALSTANDARRRQDLRRRSADALAASQARHGFAGANSFRWPSRPRRSFQWANGRCAPPAATPPRAKSRERSRSICRRSSSATSDLAETIHAILIETGLSPRRLELEVTESTIMSDQSHGLHILRKLKAMGISIAMDDFGTGYSSLATLHAFPFDKLKLDQSFVKRLPDDAAAAAIVRTVLALGESLGMPVLAEGIETEAQWQFLTRAGCAKGQGYLFAKPVAVAKLPAAIDAAARFVRDEPASPARALKTAAA